LCQGFSTRDADMPGTIGFHRCQNISNSQLTAFVKSVLSVVMDLKTPGSNECDRNLMSNISHLKATDQVKFVICDRRDYDWAKAKVDQYDLQGRVGEVLFSPSFGQVMAKDLAEWILNDRLQVRMQLQLHKFIWGDEPGH